MEARQLTLFLNKLILNKFLNFLEKGLELLNFLTGLASDFYKICSGIDTPGCIHVLRPKDPRLELCSFSVLGVETNRKNP